MGTGKSTLARALAEASGIDVLSTDRARRALLGASAAPAGYGEGLYRPAARLQVYDALFRQAAVLLDNGQSAILDGSFFTRELRDRANDLGRRHGAVPVEVLCECPRETALDRIQQRAQSGRSDSEARAELYDRQRDDFEPPGEEFTGLRVDTTTQLPQQTQQVYGELRRALSAT
jgi:predicted kinase